MEQGIYSIDFEQDALLRYKLITSCESEVLRMVERENNLIFSFFLNIEQALALYGERGYISGIEEIGYVVNLLKQRFAGLNMLFLPEQEVTHDVGLNIKKCLLIESLGYRG